MCLAIPVLIIEINERVATVDFGGVRQKVRTDLLKEISVGEYVLVHVGFAIEKLEKKDAEETLQILREIGYDISG